MDLMQWKWMWKREEKESKGEKRKGKRKKGNATWCHGHRRICPQGHLWVMHPLWAKTPSHSSAPHCSNQYITWYTVGPCLSHLSLPNKLSQNSAASKNCIKYLRVSVEQESGPGLAGCFWLRMTHKAVIKVLRRAAVTSSKFTHLAACWLQVLAGYWLETLVPCHPGYC